MKQTATIPVMTVATDQVGVSARDLGSPSPICALFSPNLTWLLFHCLCAEEREEEQHKASGGKIAAGYTSEQESFFFLIYFSHVVIFKYFLLIWIEQSRRYIAQQSTVWDSGI